jgi:uncharacterized membrane protein YgdD (TMEM256/DUF423 family)
MAAAAALVLAAAVAAGAFGAHALADRLDPRQRELWETGARYLAYAGLAGLAMAQLAGRGGAAAGTGLVLAGGTLFALTLFGLALGAPRSLGAVTPLGGAAMIAGLVLFALAVLRGASG